MKKSQSDLFLELACPDSNGFSRWVNITEFVGNYSSLKFSNGFSWGRKGSVLEKKFNIEVDRSLTSGNSIDRIKLNGFNTTNSRYLSQTINSEIRKELGNKPCSSLGTYTCLGHSVEIDHKDGRKEDLRVMNSATQTVNDFQPLSKAANDAKRQHCKVCKQTNKRFDASILGYKTSFTEGNENFDPSIGCKGCYWFDIKAFNSNF